MSRTMDDIQKEYANAAMAVGQLAFQIEESEKQLEFLGQEARKHKDKMRHLNKEALKLQKDAQEPAPEAEEVPSEPKA